MDRGENSLHKLNKEQGCSVVAKEIAEKECVSRRTVNNYCHREELKAFHVIPKLLKSETHLSDRSWQCVCFKDWTAEDFLHLMNFMFGLSADQIVRITEFG